MANDKVEIILDLAREIEELRDQVRHATWQHEECNVALKKEREEKDRFYKLYRESDNEYLKIKARFMEESLELLNLKMADNDRLKGVIAMTSDEFENYMQLWRLSLEDARKNYADMMMYNAGAMFGKSPMPDFEVNEERGAGIKSFSGGPKEWKDQFKESSESIEDARIAFKNLWK